MGLTALCPGTFDPVTNGHIDILRRAARSFDRVVVAVLENPAKAPLFSVEERVSMLTEAADDIDGIEVESFDGLLVDFARDRGIGVVVKGLRGEGDFDFELKMAQMNHRLTGLDTFFLPTSPQWSYISSSLIKEVVRYGGDVAGLVPDAVRARLEERLAPRRV
jgi:pantetheine-phosphate adenylyltransferase